MPDETLLLTNKDIAGLLEPGDVIPAIEDAFAELGRHEARLIPRHRLYLPRDDPDRYYWFNSIPGAVPGIDSMAIRLDSATVDVTEKRGNARWEFPGAFSGLVLLFDTDTNELLSIMHDYYLNPLRVAATSAIGIDHLAREDAGVLGLFGSGAQAAVQLPYTEAVRDLDEVRVYSTTPERREDFAGRMDDVVDADVRAVAAPEDAVQGCDIVTTATNSNEPVFDGEWLEPGTHVNTMIGSDRFVPRRETDDATLRRSDVVVVNSLESAELDRQPELYPPLRRGDLHRDDVIELQDLVIRRVHGRSMSSQITYHNNNVGMGIQFAVLGRLAYEEAAERGLGTGVDSSLFMQHDEDLIDVRDRHFLHME